MTRIGVILAGGLGKRMNSHLPKPAHKIGDCSMLQHVIHKMDKINITKIYVVFGKKGEQIKTRRVFFIY
jgi:bifunctional N-acetylglucosamine-1-phosphate-uridyltransferase/glucosamine-1-phosphate-acetyltransferase GlmU-like protein